MCFNWNKRNRNVQVKGQAEPNMLSQQTGVFPPSNQMKDILHQNKGFETFTKPFLPERVDGTSNETL
jgi:hypothetical protein